VRDYTGAREVTDFADFAKKGHKQATASEYPLPSFLMYGPILPIVSSQPALI
jgi:hypothetical protein